MIKRIIVLTACAVVLALAVLNVLFWQSALVGIIAGGLWLTGTPLLAGSLFGGDRQGGRLSLGLLVTLCLIILVGSSSFYLSRFTDFHIALIALFIPVMLLWIDWQKDESLIKEWLGQKKIKNTKYKIKFPLKDVLEWLRANWISLILLTAYAGLYTLALSTILNHQTAEAIRSPWEVVPRTVLFIYFLATLVLFLLLFFSSSRNEKISFPMRFPLFTLLLISLHFFLSFSLVVLIYRIGFGFDPFVHRATETILSDFGAITPKPYLYVGQYALVAFLAKLFSLPIALVDKWLLPLLASLLLPSLILFSFKKTFPARAPTDSPFLLHFTILTLLILPVFFIATIPQPFANLLYLVLLFLSLPYLSGRHFPLSLLWGIGIAIFFIHALTGIPALVYLTLLTILSHAEFRFRKAIMLCAPLCGALAIPGLVALGNALNGSPGSAGSLLHASAPLPFPALVPGYLPFLSLAHTAELWHRVLPALFFIAAVSGTVLLWKQGRRGLTIVPWLTAISLAVSYLLIRNVNLSAIIAYERGEFTERILEIIGITLLPLFAYAIWQIWEQLYRTPKKFMVSAAAIAALITIGWYYSYPRVDAFAKSRGFSVSQTDIDAVRWIEDDAEGEPYIVLANQSVAAAALQAFGFKQYFNTSQGTLFFYPIPTSSPLYQYYLAMVYQEPTRETVEEAMALAGVNRAYFVLNDYWLDAEKTASRAQPNADILHAINSVRIYGYLR